MGTPHGARRRQHNRTYSSTTASGISPIGSESCAWVFGMIFSGCLKFYTPFLWSFSNSSLFGRCWYRCSIGKGSFGDISRTKPFIQHDDPQQTLRSRHQSSCTGPWISNGIQVRSGASKCHLSKMCFLCVVFGDAWLDSKANKQQNTQSTIRSKTYGVHVI